MLLSRLFLIMLLLLLARLDADAFVPFGLDLQPFFYDFAFCIFSGCGQNAVRAFRRAGWFLATFCQSCRTHYAELCTGKRMRCAWRKAIASVLALQLVNFGRMWLWIGKGAGFIFRRTIC